MKNRNKLYLLMALIVIVSLSSCFHFNDHDVSITVSDDDDQFEMDANYKRSQAHDIQVYLNEHLLNGEINLRRDNVDKEITLDDKTTFHLSSNPGSLNISIDKTENSEESCQRIREACEDLKEILAKN